MERKDFLRSSLGFLSIGTLAVNCNKTTDVPATTTDSTTTTGGTTSSGTCTVTDTDTEGPYPTHSPSSFVRQDIRDGQAGVTQTINITVKNVNNSCAVLSGAIVDIWHCSALGYYSEYASNPGGGSYSSVDTTSLHFLRGRQTSDSNGLVSFTSIFPGWYSGRAPHIHVHIYSSNGNSLLVTQIALPEDVYNTVYTTAADYKTKGTPDTSNEKDSILSDSLDTELATVTGSISAGYTLTHSISVQG